MTIKLKLFLATILLFAPLPIFAISAKSGEVVILDKDQVIDGNYYVAANSIEIYGAVNGDLFLVGNSIKIDSEQINGDVFAAGNSLRIKGKINGSLRLAGQYLELDGEVARKVMAFGQSLDLSADSLVKEHLNFYGQSLGISGKVEGRVEGAMESFRLSGEINKDVELYIDNSNNQGVQLADSAKVNGALYYQAIKEKLIDNSDKISGGVHFNQLAQKAKKDFGPAKAFGMSINFFGLLTIGMILLYLWPKLFSQAIDLVYKKPANTFFKGFILLVITPILSILLLITLIGIPLALIVIVFWCLALYLAQIISAWVLGKWLKDKIFKKYHWSNLLILIFGIILYLLLSKIPFIGWVALMILYFMAWGVFMDLVSSLKVKK
ncbi:MAG: polymer-forming cytoskeletal protein [bacterium]|nr:polymer-forming cytoskeletal protein [bacterium]